MTTATDTNILVAQLTDLSPGKDFLPATHGSVISGAPRLPVSRKRLLPLPDARGKWRCEPQRGSPTRRNARIIM